MGQVPVQSIPEFISVREEQEMGTGIGIGAFQLPVELE